MASMIDSEAFFASRCERAGLSGQIVKKLKSLGWSTSATFAFSVLDQNDEKAWIDKVLQPVLGDDRSDAARLRRMFLEAYTHTAADLKRQTELTEQDAPRRHADCHLRSWMRTWPCCKRKSCRSRSRVV